MRHAAFVRERVFGGGIFLGGWHITRCYYLEAFAGRGGVCYNLLRFGGICQQGLRNKMCYFFPLLRTPCASVVADARLCS